MAGNPAIEDVQALFGKGRLDRAYAFPYVACVARGSAGLTARMHAVDFKRKRLSRLLVGSGGLRQPFFAQYARRYVGDLVAACVDYAGGVETHVYGLGDGAAEGAMQEYVRAIDAALGERAVTVIGGKPFEPTERVLWAAEASSAPGLRIDVQRPRYEDLEPPAPADWRYVHGAEEVREEQGARPREKSRGWWLVLAACAAAVCATFHAQRRAGKVQRGAGGTAGPSVGGPGAGGL